MEGLSLRAIESVQKSELAYCKFITANDAGETGAHQAGFHIHKSAWSLAFSKEGVKGANNEKFVKISWQGDFETASRFIYYGTGTRNEYRLTRFGKGFPFLTDENIGNLLVLSRRNQEYFEAFVLNLEEDIEAFLTAFGLSASEANRLIEKKIKPSSELRLLDCFSAFIKSIKFDFPTTQDLSANARICYNLSHGITEETVLMNPDRELLHWLEAEYQLFKTFENDRYGEVIKSPFKTVEHLVEFANTILNRRKSRAGKSLEHHLSAIFDLFGIEYSVQAKTEENKRPDFLFPSEEAYHDPDFKAKNLVFLAAKTTCKDRWRQILNEADKIKEKHLFTLQQGISSNQLAEMYKYGVRLVVPKPYVESFPKEFRPQILTMETLIPLLRSKQ